MRTITCAFLKRSLDNVIFKECIANVTYGTNCDQKLNVHSGGGTGYSVTTSPLDLTGNIAKYCFTVTARSNDETVIVEGTLNLLNNGKI